MMLDVIIVICWWRTVSRRRYAGVSGDVVIFLELSANYTDVCSLCGNSSSCSVRFCVLFICMLYNKKIHTEKSR